MQIKFQCPDCGEESIKEVIYSDQTECILNGTVAVDQDGIVTFKYKEVFAGGGIHGEEYQCNGCGKELASDREELIDWLKQVGMIDE